MKIGASKDRNSDIIKVMKGPIKANINSIQPRYKRDQRYNGRTIKSLIYTESYAHKDKEKDNFLKEYNPERIIDAWFTKNDISSLKFKCKTWSKAKRLANKYVYKQLKELVPCKSILYSRTAGCSCGCSPGYFITEPELEEHKGISAWVDDIVLNDEERYELLWNLEQLTKELKEEIRAHDEALVTA